MNIKQTEALKLARDFISAEWGFGGTTDIEPSKIVRMLEEALAEQPAQVDPCIDGSCSCCWAHLDKQPAQQQEPILVDWDTKTDKPIYTTLSSRKPLTYVEIERLYHKCAKYQEEPMEVSGWQEFARAIEAAHGIKGDA